MQISRLVGLGSALAFTACAPAVSDRSELPPGGEGVASNSGPPVDAPTAPAFENPGGMWMPEQLALHGETLKKIGFTLDPSALTKPSAFPLGAVVFLGGCSASFVSPDGLVVTNHHCVTSALQYSSKPEDNLLEKGFLAQTRADEKFAGPTARVMVTEAFRDVTTEVREGLAGMKDDLARYDAIESRQKKLVSECEKGKDGTRCSVVSYFGGAQYTLIEQLEIRDVRVVYAPAAGIGNYGGEIDNWRWPRHTGDFAFYRAYVGKDGRPADYSEANVPYKPPHVLKVSRTPLRAGDGVMVAGYPARTNRLTTAAEVKEAVSWDLPRRIDFCEVYLAELERIAKTDKDLAIKGETFIRGLANWLTNTKGQLEGLTQGGLLAKKEALELDLARFVDADPARKTKYGAAIADVNRIFAESRKFRTQDAATWELLRMVRLFGAAHTIVRNAEERDKPDDKRDPDFQERNQKRQEQNLAQLSKSYAPELDSALLKLVIERELKFAPEERAGIAEAVIGKTKNAPTGAEIEQAIAKLYKTTKLGDEKARVELLQKGRTASLKANPDPLIKLALKLRPTTKAFEERSKRLDGAMSLPRPLFVLALRDHAGGVLAPDANRTLRISFGTVRGYAPKPDAPVFTPFTLLPEVVAKHTGKDPFIAPQRLLDAVAANKPSAYADEKLGAVPVDFLADLDITGGNSGSATLNGKGELVGLAFDGNYESMASDWQFMQSVTRSIHVDARYMLWVMDAVDNADHLLREMGIEPTL